MPFKKIYQGTPSLGSLPEDGFGRTEFTYAILHHRTHEALSLLKHYDNVNHKDNAGCSDLYFAAQSRELEVLRELLRRGADPNIETYTGVTPLKAALDSVQAYSHRIDFNSYECAFEMIKLLLEAGADPDQKSGNARTARQLAKYMAPGKIADYLQGFPKLKEDMSEIRFQSKWFERCVKDFLGIKDRTITNKDVQEIKYLFVTTTHGYGLSFAKSLPSELFQTCAFYDAGDEWAFECIEDTGKYQLIEEFLEFDSSNLDDDRKVHTIRLRGDIKRFHYDGSLAAYKLAQRVMRDFEKNVKVYDTYKADLEGLDEDEVTHDRKLLIPKDFCRLTNLEVLRLMSCQTEIHSLKFLDALSKLRVLEIGEVLLNNLDGLENLIGLEKLCIWSN